MVRLRPTPTHKKSSCYSTVHMYCTVAPGSWLLSHIFPVSIVRGKTSRGYKPIHSQTKKIKVAFPKGWILSLFVPKFIYPQIFPFIKLCVGIITNKICNFSNLEMVLLHLEPEQASEIIWLEGSERKP